MKKFVLLIAIGLALTVTASHAQSLAANQGYLKASGVHTTTPITDTVTNTAVVNQIAAVPGYHDVIAFQSTITKLSGTGAGTAALYVSLDGTNFTAVPSQSYTLTDVATQAFTWSVSPSAYSYYQIKITGSGTESLKVKSIYTWRNRPRSN